ncbi:hypothetical protein GUITHDRAFT_133411 [Guillardia theta CCMP2712]|uniref:Uncharacterized protein n=1 Tax=Guillardia theta (strain CCMP2712) TaxID=905079 RepID=L1JWR3_GUITC|nr:hypothetical protein GUITHDRAFT_133411 [Guillardia theta CCMP2712]EKX53026.1 hypothetical protein GUITHDRAFT_133411 [Guillardia theta CCMP2712]|eukprot:XP_005840006.1 hypothetical protein GUITHDRAFT_133411 [Guillardia theta CCMP2712]
MMMMMILTQWDHQQLLLLQQQRSLNAAVEVDVVEKRPKASHGPEASVSHCHEPGWGRGCNRRLCGGGGGRRRLGACGVLKWNKSTDGPQGTRRLFLGPNISMPKRDTFDYIDSELGSTLKQVEQQDKECLDLSLTKAAKLHQCHVWMGIEKPLLQRHELALSSDHVDQELKRKLQKHAESVTKSAGYQQLGMTLFLQISQVQGDIHLDLSHDIGKSQTFIISVRVEPDRPRFLHRLIGLKDGHLWEIGNDDHAVRAEEGDAFSCWERLRDEQKQAICTFFTHLRLSPEIADGWKEFFSGECRLARVRE